MEGILNAIGLPTPVLLALATMGLTVNIIMEQSQLLAKYLGVVRDRVAGGYNAAMKVMVINRFGSVFYFLLISISIEAGMGADTISLFFAVAIFTIAAFDLAVSIRLSIRNGFSFRDLFATDLAATPVLMSIVAAFFNILGLTLPMLMSAANPTLRLTLANTGFLLNAVFTIITVFFVESYLARIIDDPDQKYRTVHFVIAVFAMRFIGAVIALALVLFLSQETSLLHIEAWI